MSLPFPCWIITDLSISDDTRSSVKKILDCAVRTVWNTEDQHQLRGKAQLDMSVDMYQRWNGLAAARDVKATFSSNGIAYVDKVEFWTEVGWGMVDRVNQLDVTDDSVPGPGDVADLRRGPDRWPKTQVRYNVRCRKAVFNHPRLRSEIAPITQKHDLERHWRTQDRDWKWPVT